GNPLESSARAIGSHLKMPDSVRGAVLYAIPSSFPELAVVVISVLFLKEPHFGIGLGTIIGSAVFNILIIPGLSVLAAGRAMAKQGKEFKGIYISDTVIHRDGLFYVVTVAALLVVVFFGGIPGDSPSEPWKNQLTPIIAWGYLGLYAIYVAWLSYDTKAHHKLLESGDTEKTPDTDTPNMSLRRATTLMLGCMAIVGLLCYFLVEQTLELAKLLDIPPYVVAVVLTAAATSIPDMVISIIAAQKGGENAEDAIVNAFSSNIFDILVCLSVPVLILGTAVTIDVAEVRMSLLLLPVVTILSLGFMRSNHILGLKEGIILLMVYLLFVVSAYFNASILEFFS
ncbi:MAG TPA: sodium:calcium antiporter, partial [Myxococcales bacterium]|nr:sodium:calcium antiporter [Myxococcales bacterium]